MVSLTIEFDIEKYRELIEDFDNWFEQKCKELKLSFYENKEKTIIEGSQFSLIEFYGLLSQKQQKSFDDILKEVL